MAVLAPTFGRLGSQQTGGLTGSCLVKWATFTGAYSLESSSGLLSSAYSLESRKLTFFIWIYYKGYGPQLLRQRISRHELWVCKICIWMNFHRFRCLPIFNEVAPIYDKRPTKEGRILKRNKQKEEVLRKDLSRWRTRFLFSTSLTCGVGPTH